MLFDAAASDQWLETKVGRYVFARQEKLVLDLLQPAAGESLLDVDCGKGNFLRIFQKRNCLLTGCDSSPVALAAARGKVNGACELIQANSTDLPFSDNEFDVVTLINGFRDAGNPQKMIAEAVRVCRGRLFIGFFNRHSLAGMPWSMRKFFGFSGAKGIHLFSIREMHLMINNAMTASSVTWGSVVYLPISFYTFFSELEEILPVNKNPLGAFAGMVVPIRYTYRTLHDPVKNAFTLKGKTRPVTADVSRRMLRERDV